MRISIDQKPWYLVTLIHKLLNFNKTAEALHYSASRALGAILCKMNKCGGFPFYTYKMFVESCVFSISDYGTEKTGYYSHPESEAIYMRVLRSFLGMKKTMPKEGIKAEFKWVSPQSLSHIRMIRQFLRIKNLPDSRFTKKILFYDMQFSNLGQRHCWNMKVNDILTKYGLGHFFLNHATPKT